MNHLYTTEGVLELARECLHMGMQERPELEWLKERHVRIRCKYQLKNKQETDAFLYERMYGRAPAKDSEALKIRYWRTGRYMPANREQCLRLGKALELLPEEMAYLLQNYYDRCLDVYDASMDLSDVRYQEKKDCMKKLAGTYIQNASPKRMICLNISLENPQACLRHLYFTDAFHYIDTVVPADSDILLRHITSTSYESEFARQMKLLGEIPRKTMLRHLIIFNLPQLTLDIINQQLAFLGYLPLCEEHTMAGAERLDWLLIRIIQLYEALCDKTDEEKSLAWFQKTCRVLDRFFVEEKEPKMRFMHFKALDLQL